MSELQFVLSVTLAVWIGVFVYLLHLDSRLRGAQRREKV
ncbi:MAG: hypothetical protein DDT34_01368 [Firmicutes bacterium]|nr:hypothetical protein [Bacillota bacterium]MBT9158259.1 hypothetical protein [Bacillota bacterium]